MRSERGLSDVERVRDVMVTALVESHGNVYDAKHWCLAQARHEWQGLIATTENNHPPSVPRMHTAHQAAGDYVIAAFRLHERGSLEAEMDREETKS